METKQQKEALAYFKKYARVWNDKIKIPSQERDVIQQRNGYVIHVVEKREKTEIALDVGCGAGDLVYEIAKRGIRAIGVDFAEEMIQISRDNAKKRIIN